MKLATYLSDNEVSDLDFAAMIGVTRSMVTKLRRGSAKPSADTALEILRATDGKVGLEDLVSGRKPATAPLFVGHVAP